MAVLDQTIEIFRGEEITVNFTMDPVPDGGIAGWTLLFTAVRAYGVADKAVQVAGAVVDGALGKFRVVLDADDTNLPPQTYVYDVWRMDAGNLRLLAAGNLVVKPVARLPLSS